ncbi:hypothetical protein ASG01_13670 [Chryseobacterium sp. Leaf180]|uniref:hypothetical protein n=1 Tax=Chryseobacterium sp. Leaf180 TaxID=1736289 RepID=UPI0006F4CA60|nr:hypothetical protein [Chryseobacterium sp. Leaf180]KQR91418.1 hypothetical protein ASG01_13670 [Chryseobacterium sp. Leaf180]
MKKIYFLSLLFIYGLMVSQTSMFGNVNGLAFRKYSVKDSIVSTDTIVGRTMNYHLIKDLHPQTFFKKLSTEINSPTIFMVSNKFGGIDKKIYAKIGTTVISTLGIDDVNDSLRINSNVTGSKIVVFGKNDPNRKIIPSVFILKKTDPNLMIPEILLFNRNLGFVDQQKVETYLSIKYGITINDISEKNYITSSNTIVWNSEENKQYNFRVTGIGRDDVFKLYQKQSQNWEDFKFAMSLGALQYANNQNLKPIINGSFLLWGDNNQQMVFKDVDLISSHPQRDMHRIWKVQVKNAPGNNFKTHAYLRHSGLALTDMVFLRLFKNEADYQNDISVNTEGQRINDSLFVFPNIDWDVDLNKIDYFTFTLSDLQSRQLVNIISSCTEMSAGIVKVGFPANFGNYTYTLINENTLQNIHQNLNGTAGTLQLNNLQTAKYKLLIHRPGQSDIVRLFDLEGIVNQNVQDKYVWNNVPIELNLNTTSFKYTLISPSGAITNSAPYKLTSMGNYQLKINNKLNCEVIKVLKVLTQVEYDTQNSNTQFKNITVSPNPSHDGNFTVKVELFSSKTLTIQVFNALGMLMKQVQIPANTNFNIPLNIPPMVGYYSIKILIPEESKGVNFLIN